MTRAIKPIALAILCWICIIAGIWLGQRIAQRHCPTTPPHITTRVVTRTIYAPMPMPSPSPIVVTARPGPHHTLCLYVNGKGPIDPIGLKDCWGAPDKEYKDAHGHVIDPY